MVDAPCVGMRAIHDLFRFPLRHVTALACPAWAVLSAVGCASLPAAPIEQAPPPAIAVAAPLPGQAQVFVEAVDAPNAQLDEVIGKTMIPYAYHRGFPLGRREIGITKERCAELPCVVDVPRGESVLEASTSSGAERERFRVDVADGSRTLVRVRLPQHETPALGVLGWTLVSVAAAPMIAGGTLLGIGASQTDSSAFTIPGGVMLGASAVVATIGLVLAFTHPITSRPGNVAAWTLSPR
jgi:hypothetical protein